MIQWLNKLTSLTKKKERIVAGAMSGTSVDGIDIAICAVEGAGLYETRIKLLSLFSESYMPKVQKRVKDLQNFSVRDFAELHLEIGKEFVRALQNAFNDSGLKSNDIDLIGSHGQTVYHHSCKPNHVKSTLQIGDGDLIAEYTNIPVYSDFRMKDIVQNGQGAPLLPYADFIFYNTADQHRVILNLGGIGNITVLDKDPSKVIGFDTGPANAPLDRLVNIITSGAESYDHEGTIAKSGKVNTELLQKLLAEDAYVALQPPKSTGTEVYGDEFVTRLIHLHGRADPDLLATAVSFISATIKRAVINFSRKDIDEIIAAGGGTKNSFLLETLQKDVFPIKVINSDSLGVPSKAREAMAFAIFANNALFGIPNVLPSVTGAHKASVMGKLSMPSC
jgi:anhydro-N-acetylmuramic acid kinase